MPLSWLLLLAGWKYLPEVDKGRVRVMVQSPEGKEVELTRSRRCTTWTKKPFGQLWLISGSEMGPVAV